MTEERPEEEGQQESGSNAEAAGEASDEAKEKMAELEKDPPEKLEDWPKDEAMYQTFGGPEGDHAYDEGPERKLGLPAPPRGRRGEHRGREGRRPREVQGGADPRRPHGSELAGRPRRE
jgi:hypothetical protein